MNIHPKLQIIALKQRLQATDYKAIKYFEGWLTEEEYSETKAERQHIREEINRLEALLAQQDGATE